MSSAGDLAIIDGVCSCNRNEGYYGRDKNKCAVDDGTCRKAGYQLTIDGMWCLSFWIFIVGTKPFNKGTFTHLKWSLVPPDFKGCCIRYSWKLLKF